MIVLILFKNWWHEEVEDPKEVWFCVGGALWCLRCGVCVCVCESGLGVNLGVLCACERSGSRSVIDPHREARPGQLHNSHILSLFLSLSLSISLCLDHTLCLALSCDCSPSLVSFNFSTLFSNTFSLDKLATFAYMTKQCHQMCIWFF